MSARRPFSHLVKNSSDEEKNETGNVVTLRFFDPSGNLFLKGLLIRAIVFAYDDLHVSHPFVLSQQTAFRIRRSVLSKEVALFSIYYTLFWSDTETLRWNVRKIPRMTIYDAEVPAEGIVMCILDRAFPNHINLTHVFAYFFPAIFKRRFLNPVLSSRNPVLSGQSTCPARGIAFFHWVLYTGTVWAPGVPGLMELLSK